MKITTSEKIVLDFDYTCINRAKTRENERKYTRAEEKGVKSKGLK